MFDSVLRLFGRAASTTESFTCLEVRERLLQAPEAQPRTAAVHAAAADVGGWTALLSQAAAFELGRSADRLPSVVFWYVNGRPLPEIGRALRPLGGPWDAEHALDVAGCLIAGLLNHHSAVGLASMRGTRREHHSS